MRYTFKAPPNVAPAMSPHIGRSVVSSSNGVVVVDGEPGTFPIPAPRPAATAGLTSVDPRTQPSAVTPDHILPALYTVGQRNQWDAEHFPGLLLSDHELPVPARKYYSLPGVAFNPAHIGGRAQIGQPRPLIRWPWLNRGQASG